MKNITYHALLPHAFRRFCALSAFRTALPTLAYFLRRRPLPQSPKPALCTMNVFPPLMTVWFHFAKRALGDRADIVIFDCSGGLNPADVPGARVLRFLNLYAATKCDEFLCRIAANRRIGWICDDDMFLLSGKCVDILEREFAVEDTASVSFRPRPWWRFVIDGKTFPPSGSYCTAINREIFCNRERLSLAPQRGNPHPSVTGRQPKSYDTFDKANEILLRKGYRCVVLKEEEQRECVTGFHGVSMGVMLLHYFHTADRTADYFLSPPKERWGGTVLHDAFGAMLALNIIRELHEKLTGKRLSPPSLPNRRELQKIRREREPFLGNGRSWKWVDAVEERLHAAL